MGQRYWTLEPQSVQRTPLEPELPREGRNTTAISQGTHGGEALVGAHKSYTLSAEPRRLGEPILEESFGLGNSFPCLAQIR
jgi:hypothetical protein